MPNAGDEVGAARFETAIDDELAREARAFDAMVRERGREYDANFVGLPQDPADLACRRLQARAVQCFTMGP